MTYEIIPTTPNTPEWLELRKQGLGGSDTAAALGMSKWRTPYDVYLDKIGEAAPLQENEAMYWGKAHEANIIRRYERDNKLRADSPSGIYRSAKHPFMLYTPDSITQNRRLLEVKTSRYGDGFGETGSDEIPQEYLFQVQKGMIVTGLPVCDVAVLIGGSEYRQYEIPAHKELQEMIIELEHKFWHENVLKRVEPDLTTTEDIKKRYRFSNGSAIQADDAIYQKLHTLKEIKESLKADEATKEDFEGEIKRFMGENEALEYCGQTLATWKNTKTGVKFDTKAFESAHPDLYNQFLIETASQRRFLVK